MPTNPGDIGGPIFIPISFQSDATDTVTEPTTINFTVTLPPDQGQPPLSLNAFEVQSQPQSYSVRSLDQAESEPVPPPNPIPIYQYLAMAVTAPPNLPDLVWGTDGVARCSWDIDYNVINSLHSGQTVLALVVSIDGNSNSMGMCNVAISFPTARP